MAYPPDAYYDDHLKLLNKIESHLSDISSNVLDMTERLERVEKSLETFIAEHGAE